MLEFHTAWAWVVVLANGLAGAWCLAAHWLPAVRVRAVWWLVVAAEAAVGVQVVLGVLLIAGQDYSAPEFHVFYGFLMVVDERTRGST